ncbi:Alpha-ketoglutarate-dependent dioxygenase AlkB [Achromobacter deleyi]|uniref:Alpha-ketoglutarate-dependent dioxygenase AlkB n=1 Tax=Achromobacter deleyi TaxID=1353891 RepID=A0A6S6ZC23_9BURK|nr:DNA oxidative demethylase AlkB [Achromobacter deleyi]CAB3667525.1 Alpha-ketoglutarate-dependent dioxygenase AlkB [Achromobacter deleyi]CAB3832171.1 Alpha-ketoglutarate-dependent dioxygenase AlkB [Achromobacter deleyi]CAB3856820.1 Alpha-ketoglutarate-dependent dioxygenase AlkB [Achromobacter deleyi]CAB3862656.1 Alpha-ketoglutarate-dependent dioxygenase AlkB [Achromobacter deleyi]
MGPTLDLFGDDDTAQSGREMLGEQSVVLRGYALPDAAALLAGVDAVTQQAPFRNMVTPGGYTMSVALTNCGRYGWTTDAHGYRYSRNDPLSGQPWPDMPAAFDDLARRAAAEAGFPGFAPDACLVNRYEPGSRLSLHQDKDERDYGWPIVSVSLGMPAVFLFGGHERADKSQRVPLLHGDVVVWGGVDRLRFHGVMPLKDHPHPLLGSRRINFTIRRAG